MNHVQCLLEKEDKIQVSWIPEKYAKLGKVLKLGNNDGWVVTEKWEKENSKTVNILSQLYKHQRKVSDI